MNKMTKQQAIENHRKMWNWIADKTLELKRKVWKAEYFLAMGIFDKPIASCYCCAYINHKYDCNLCPVVWVDKNGVKLEKCTCFSSIFNIWCFTDDYKEAAICAKAIAELPERR